MSIVDRQVKLRSLGWRFKDVRNDPRGRVVYVEITSPDGQVFHLKNDTAHEILQPRDILEAICKYIKQYTQKGDIDGQG